MKPNGWALRAISFLIVVTVSMTVVMSLQSSSAAATASTIRPAVGKPLQDAVDLVKKGNGNGALRKVREAEAPRGLTMAERSAIAQTRDFILARTGVGNTNSAMGCKFKLAADYNAKRYRDVVSVDAECLKTYGINDPQSHMIVAQSHYLLGNYQTAIHLLHGLGAGENVLSLILSAAHQSGDRAEEQRIAERLILAGKLKYWSSALDAAARTPGLDDSHLLGIYRIRFLTNNMRSGNDYTMLSELALQFGSPAEAYIVAKRAADLRLLRPEQLRLVGYALSAALEHRANLATAIKQAEFDASGDMAIKIGQALWGYGRFQEAEQLLQKRIGEGVDHKDAALISLGMSQLGTGQNSGALASFAAVHDDKQKILARLWTEFALANNDTSRFPAANSLPTEAAISPAPVAARDGAKPSASSPTELLHGMWDGVTLLELVLAGAILALSAGFVIYKRYFAKSVY